MNVTDMQLKRQTKWRNGRSNERETQTGSIACIWCCSAKVRLYSKSINEWTSGSFPLSHENTEGCSPRWRKVLQKKSSFRFRISFWNQIELSQTTTKKSLKQKNYKWNSKLITKWRQLVYFGLVNGARIVVVVRRCLCCVSHLIYFIFFSSWLAGNESCLPFCWHYYSISYTG